VRYWPQDDDKNNFKDVTAELNKMEDVLLQNDRYISRFTARLTELNPGTTYSYIVGNPETNIWSDTFEFKTEPAGGKPFSFVYFGDTHKSPHFGELINIAYNKFPEVAFYTIGGDLVSSGMHRDEWDEEFEYMAEVIKNRPLMTVPGNHDYSNGLGPIMYADYFDFPRNGSENVPPEYSYSFEYGDAIFLMLSTMEEIDEQSAWIENQLKNTDKKWKFAMFHFPPYSLDEDKYPDIVEEWGTLFDKYHLDIVFNGHVHYYLRSKPIYANKPVKSPAEGTIYVTSIAIPNSADRDLKEDEFSDVFVQGEMLYQKIDINGNKLTLNAYNEKGDIIDNFDIIKK
jgi:Icc-related predicted phosphoesterase